MRITFSIDGGFAVFPGLARPVSFDVDALPADAAAAIRSAVANSDFFALDDSSAFQTPGAADARKYAITIEDGIHRRSLVVPETVAEPALKTLLHLLDEQRRASRAR